MALLAGAAALALTHQSLPIPKWAIARLETRLNNEIRASLPQSSIAIEGMSLSFDEGLAPVLVLDKVELRNLAQRPVMQLPMARIVLSRQGLLSGDIHLNQLHLVGATVAVTRDMQGQLDIAFAAGAGVDLEQIFALSDAFFVSPLGRDLTSVTVQDIAVSVHDLRLQQRWALGDGVLKITQKGNILAADLGLSLIDKTGSAKAGRVDISVTSELGTNAAQITAKIAQVSAQDLAAQVPPLAFVAVLAAPISGQISTVLTPQGATALTAQLQLGAGTLSQSAVQNTAISETAAADAAPPSLTPHSAIDFQSAQLDLAYDPASGRILLNDLLVQSDILQLRAGGHADALRADGTAIKGHFAGEWPDSFAAQLRLDSLRFLQPDMFDAPVNFTAGQADITLKMAPFSLTVTHAQLANDAARIRGDAQWIARPNGWQGSLDAQVDALPSRDLLALWPKTMVRGTRAWLVSNLQEARFTDITFALRKAADSQAQVDVGFHFDDMTVTALSGLPRVTQAAGYGAVSGHTFSLVLDQGRTTPPLGGPLDLAGSVFSIADTRVFPATAKLTLQSHGTLTATLSLIDQPPFRFMAKSGRAADFASGDARLTTQLTLPLQKVVTFDDITLQISGKVTEFATDQLAADRRITATELDVFVTKDGLRVGGRGKISDVDFDGTYTLPFGAQGDGSAARVTARAALTDAALRQFGVQLPKGMVSGEGGADVTLDFPSGQPAQMTVTSNLRGVDLRIGAIGYRKTAKTAGDLKAKISLTSPPQVTELALSAGDLQASGAVRLGATGALDQAKFPEVTIGKWFAGEVIFSAKGQSAALVMTVPRGTVDMRFLPQSSGGGAASDGLPIALRLDRLRVSDGIILTGFQGDFRAEASGLRGNFAAQVAGGAALQGQLSPSQHGTEVRLTSQNAGAALAQSGLYSAARGGQLDAVLTPQKTAGHYLGNVQMAGIRVQSSSILAELLNAISIVGLLDQLGGAGILFNRVSGQFLLTPQGLELREGVATGGSLGVTMQGVHRFAGSQLQMQGVISPIYLINGVGAVVSKRGEGILGFNYKLRGTVDEPKVQVNPLSVLLPGFLRNIFKAPPAQLDTPSP